MAPFGMTQRIEPIEGEMVLFPAWLSHTVEPTVLSWEGSGGGGDGDGVRSEDGAGGGDGGGDASGKHRISVSCNLRAPGECTMAKNDFDDDHHHHNNNNNYHRRRRRRRRRRH